MAKWIDTVVKIIVELIENDTSLAREILLIIKRLERKPTTGEYVEGTYRVYHDPKKRFRIGYNFRPDAEEIEIVVLHLLNYP